MTTAAPAPNFFIVGAPKAGTTSLYRYLDQHPAIYMSPIKEPCFFAPEVADFGPAARERYRADRDALRLYLEGPMLEPRPGGIVLEWDPYLHLFKHVRAETAIGEASVSYLGSASAAPAIHARIPRARIVAILRDPAARLFSHYSAARASQATRRSFVSWIDEHVAAEAARHPTMGPIWSGRYATHVAQYRALFPERQLHWCLYEDYARDPTRVLAGVLRFLDVDPAWPIDVRERHNVTRVPRWPALHAAARAVAARVRAVAPAPILARARRWWRVPRGLPQTPDERARAIALYRDEILALEPLVNRDLGAWLDPSLTGRR